MKKIISMFMMVALILSATLSVSAAELGSGGTEMVLSSGIASSLTKTYNGTATPTNYNSTAKAVDGYLGSVYIDAKVSKVIIKGIAGKTVKTINLLNPNIPAMLY
ncbi:hypothetical protein [Tannockella kyphosi]|uniref:hypothetical protein n=1 Tax=Tannockella kyphosi TaxID=2899121 RepID=UPI00201225D9|nr:hypothetical protein [Tannockella kyphosi]